MIWQNYPITLSEDDTALNFLNYKCITSGDSTDDEIQPYERTGIHRGLHLRKKKEKDRWQLPRK